MNSQEIGIQNRFKQLEVEIVKGQNSLKLITEQTTYIDLSKQLFDDESECDEPDERLSLGSNLDDSIEMKMMLLTIDSSKRIFFEKERDITQYLKNSGVLTKTDPRSKQDKYFVQKIGSQKQVLIQKSSDDPSIPTLTSSIMTPMQEFMSLQNNSIMQRRTPSNSPSSSPLNRPQIESKTTLKQDQGKKSKFFMYSQQD